MIRSSSVRSAFFAIAFIAALCSASYAQAGLGLYGGQGAASERGKWLGPAYNVVRRSHVPSAFDVPVKPGSGVEWR